MSLITALKLPNSRVLSEDYYVLLETHLPYLRTHPLTKVTEVPLPSAEKYIGDFHGLLDSIAIDKKFHYLITRLNGLVDSTAYDGKQNLLIIPDIATVAAFIETYSSIEA